MAPNIPAATTEQPTITKLPDWIKGYQQQLRQAQDHIPTYITQDDNTASPAYNARSRMTQPIITQEALLSCAQIF